MKCDESVTCKFIVNTEYCVINDPCIIRICTIKVPTKAQKYIEFSVYTKWNTCLGQPRGHLKECKIQRIDTLEV